jgi:hypothetical protein
MNVESDHCRQMRLPEVGEHGQRRLAAARVRLPPGAAAMTTVTYLERAGLGAVQVACDASAPPFPHDSVFRHSAAREIGAGAWHALRCIIEVLEEDS